MRKITSMMVCVLFSTLMFANGTEESVTSASAAAIVNPTGSSLFKVYYKSQQEGDVRVTILNSLNKPVFTERLRKVDGFIRPYNFNGLDEGVYTIEIEDGSGKMIEKVSYAAGKIDKLVKITKMKADENKYLVHVASKNSDTISVNISDDKGNSLHQGNYFVKDGFAKVFNLKEISSFTIQVSDDHGILKSVTFQ